MHPRVLIVGTVPYNTKSTSRAFDAYFHYWEKENIAQIFSNTKRPCKGHCGTLFQITDHRMLQRWMGKKADTGVIYHYEELDTEWKDNDLELGDAKAEAAYKFGGKHTPLTHLLRGILWRRRFWCTEKLNRWLDDFKPECVFLAFSDDYFIPQIAMYVARRYNVPIVSCIGDDYYFNVEKTLNPIYHLYKTTYKKLIDKVLAWPGSAIYISDKIRDKYNSEFGLDGETVYLTSTVQRKPFSVINKDCPVITYFGNIGMGRNNSLNDIGYALGKINPAYVLEVYSNEKDEGVYSVFKDNPNVRYMGSVPYTQVQKRMAESDITVIVEGFEEKDINLSRYSLSTKAADALASGASILTYGSLESGIIEYMQSTDAAMVCTDKAKLVDSIAQLISNQELQKKYYEQAIVMTREHHNLRASCKTSEDVVAKAIRHMLNESEVGYYSTALSLCNTWVFVLSAIIDSLYPTILQCFGKDNTLFEKRNKQLYAIVFYVSVVASSFISILASPIVRILYGTSYAPAASPLRIITWYTAFSYLGIARNAWVVSYQKQNYLKYLYVGSALTNVILNALLIPVMGASGAALASLVTQMSTILVFPALIKDLRPNVKLMIDAIRLKI